MWLFTKAGHLSIEQNPADPELLVVRAQSREDMSKFITLLDVAAGKRHQGEEAEGNYKFVVMARRSVVAEAVSQMVANVDYELHSFHVGFGQQPEAFVWMSPTGLQVSTIGK